MSPDLKDRRWVNTANLGQPELYRDCGRVNHSACPRRTAGRASARRRGQRSDRLMRRGAWSVVEVRPAPRVRLHIIARGAGERAAAGDRRLSIELRPNVMAVRPVGVICAILQQRAYLAVSWSVRNASRSRRSFR